MSSIQSRHWVVCNVLKVDAFYKTSWKWFSFSMPPRQFIYVYPLKSETNTLRAICQLTLKRFCTFFFAQWNSRIWCIGSGKRKTLNAKRAGFLRWKIWLNPNHCLKGNDCFHHFDTIQSMQIVISIDWGKLHKYNMYCRMENFLNEIRVTNWDLSTCGF